MMGAGKAKDIHHLTAQQHASRLENYGRIVHEKIDMIVHGSLSPIVSCPCS
jgi:hypothetical protein